jgi:hypothetical protein
MCRCVGVLLVVGRPVRGRRLLFGEPGDLLAEPTGVPVTWHGQCVGSALRVWRDGDLIRYEARLGEQGSRPPRPEPDPADARVTVPPALEALAELRRAIQQGEVVGTPVLTGARMGNHAGRTVMKGWRVSGVALMGAESAPWPEVGLRSADGPSRCG